MSRETVIEESSSAAPRRELTYVPEAPGEDRVNLALGAAVLALANLDRAIRGQRPAISAAELHPAQIAMFLKAARVTALAQHPSAVLNAVALASDELREIVDGLITDPTAAVVSDPERMKDACQGMARLVIEEYQNALYASLATVRAAVDAGEERKSD